MQKPDGIFGVFEVVKDFYEHGIDEHLWVFLLMLVIVADIILGVSRAWAFHEFSSRRFRKGLVSHTAMLIIVTVSYPFMVFMNLGGAMDAFIFAMLSAYGASILASLSALGVEIPFIDRFVKKNIDKDKFNLIEEEEDND
ncbi:MULTISPECIES: phage holin family protein [unclassified Streptococcus]|uniref:phage holin family protein n=1 Tax=unclassified Streptococcus TaxID=2608887 RepID=UPI001912F483|nr:MULTISPECIES: phage holin family protein [unclassified Streptococcus]MBK5045960.1 phage holin family protein [Streptococcus sp. 2.1]MBK5161915.1 phage holin family protein [Streptococcus sp. 3.1]